MDITHGPRRQISPGSPVPSNRPDFGSATRASTPNGTPSEPYLRFAASCGFANTTDEVSVIPIASITETPNTCSNARCCSGGSGADAQRPKRIPGNRYARPGSAAFSKYATIVGTRLIHVASYFSAASHHAETLKRCGATRLPPETNGASVAITCPLM